MDIETLFGQNTLIFNSPLEFSLRCACIIEKDQNQGIDLDRLVYYDYLILNTGDIADIPSIHPALPFRGAQVLVKREIIKHALVILISKQLVDVKFDPKGITYYKNELTSAFVKFLESSYVIELTRRINWVSERFANYSDVKLSEYIDSNLEKWGGEFVKEAAFRNTQTT